MPVPRPIRVAPSNPPPAGTKGDPPLTPVSRKNSMHLGFSHTPAYLHGNDKKVPGSDDEPNGSGPGHSINQSSGGSSKSQKEVADYQRRVRRIFGGVLDGVDSGEITFSDNLEEPPTGIDTRDFEEFCEEIKIGASDALGAVVDTPLYDTKELENRISLVKWLLGKFPGVFIQDNFRVLYNTISKYNHKDSWERGVVKRRDVYRRFANEVLADESFKDECRNFLNTRSTATDTRYNLHTAVKQMGVDIIPHLDLIDVDKGTMLHRDQDGNTPLHLAVAVEHWRKDEKPEKRVELVSELIARCKDSLALTTINGRPETILSARKSPYRYHQSSCKREHPEYQVACTIPACRKVEFVLKDAYMHLKERQLLITHLYNSSQGAYFHLDLSELAVTIPSPKSFLKDIANSLRHVKLDNILRYVCLPKDLLLAQPSIEKPDEYINYSVVFDWLRKKNVEKIIHLRVDDNEILPHSDDVIVSSLEGIDIEVWDWVQYDMCCDTIFRAAETVQEVFLYSTGKRAVLENWTSVDGLAKLIHLEKINIRIDVQPCSGTFTVMDKNTLESRLKTSGVTIKPDIKIIYPQSSKSKNGAGNLAKSSVPSGEVAETDSWIKCAERFAELINNIPEDVEANAGNPIVKIAIIDDGVNTHEQRFMSSRIGGGISFYKRGTLENGHEEKFSHHFPSSSGHGTEMADRIHQVFPKAKLYIARLNVYPGDSNNMTITAQSAAEAINWAVKQNVDIISMSWTVEKTGTNESDIAAMGVAIDEAHKKNILMFCAAKDGGYGKGGNFGYPKNFGKPVFCIGATTKHGKLSESIGSQEHDIDFGLPGENLKPAFGDSKAAKISGSSIATALASGLAGLLLYCIEIEQSIGPKQAENRRTALQRHERMKSTLLRMAADNKYIDMPSHFDLGDSLEWIEGGNTAFKDIVGMIRGYMEKSK